jgi:hypothetical protein
MKPVVGLTEDRESFRTDTLKPSYCGLAKGAVPLRLRDGAVQSSDEGREELIDVR